MELDQNEMDVFADEIGAAMGGTPVAQAQDDGLDDVTIEESGESSASDDRPRDENGRFTNKELLAGKPEAQAATSEQPATPAAQTGPWKPSTWRPEAVAEWDKLPPTVRAEVEKREREMLDGIEQYKTDATTGKRMSEVFAPFNPILQQYNVDPVEHARNLFAVHHQLLTGDKPTQVRVLGTLMQELGLSPADFGGAVQAPGAQGNSPGVPAELAPVLAPLQSTVQDATVRLNQIESRLEQERRTSIRSQVEAFAADPANKYFNEVADDIVRLRRQGHAPDLAKLYETAIWTNPTVRIKVIAEQQAAEAAKLAEQNANKVQAARAASATNVRSRQTNGAGTRASTGSIEDTMNSVMEKHFGSS